MFYSPPAFWYNMKDLYRSVVKRYHGGGSLPALFPALGGITVRDPEVLRLFLLYLFRLVVKRYHRGLQNLYSLFESGRACKILLGQNLYSAFESRRTCTRNSFPTVRSELLFLVSSDNRSMSLVRIVRIKANAKIRRTYI